MKKRSVRLTTQEPPITSGVGLDRLQVEAGLKNSRREADARGRQLVSFEALAQHASKLYR